MQQSVFLFLGSLCAFLGVAAGAGEHLVAQIPNITQHDLDVYKTAVNYQLFHALGLILIALMKQHSPTSVLLNWAGWLMLIGILLFSGSLYLKTFLALDILKKVTPLGGISFLISWSLMIIFSGKKPQKARYKSSRYDI